MKRFIVIGTITTMLVVSALCVYAINYFQLQSLMNSVTTDEARNNGIKVSVHYKSYVNTSVLIYDLKSISGSNSMADVFRVFLQFADKIQSRKFDNIELAYRGEMKFKIDGDYFQTLGKEFSRQNPIYTVRTFPENLMKPDGSKAYPQWTGGVLGVVKKQMENFDDFHRKWYLDEITQR